MAILIWDMLVNQRDIYVTSGMETERYREVIYTSSHMYIPNYMPNHRYGSHGCSAVQNPERIPGI